MSKKRSINAIDDDVNAPPNPTKKFIQSTSTGMAIKNDEIPISTYIHMDSNLRKELEEFIKECMKTFDASHDFYHIERVRNLALEIAKKENICDLELVELCALLHDVNDHKYINKNDNNKSVETNNNKISKILNKYNISKQKQDIIKLIIDNMSFSKEIKIKKLGKPEYNKYLLLFKEYPSMGCIQDADRLDAIGSIGIARTFVYGSTKNKQLFNYPISNNNNLNVNQWIKENKSLSTCVHHFYEKLLLLKDMMKTKTGKEIANKKHQIMELFVESFLNEWQGNQ